MPFSSFFTKPPPASAVLPPPAPAVVTPAVVTPAANNTPMKPNFKMPEKDVNLLVCTHQNRILNNIIKPWNMLVNKNNNDLRKNQPLIDPKIRFSNCSVLSLKIMPKLKLDASKPSNEFSVSLVLAYVGNTNHNKKKKYWIEEVENTELEKFKLFFTPVTFPNTIITISNNNISDLSNFFGISNIVLQKIKQTGKAIRVLCFRHALSPFFLETSCARSFK